MHALAPTGKLRPVLLATLAIALGGGACAHEPAGWKHVSSPHFELYSLQGRHAYAAVLERLEMVHTILSSYMFSGKSVPGFEVMLYEPEEALPILGQYAASFRADMGREGLLVMANGASSEYVDTTAAHGLAYKFLRAAFPAAPVWFVEGYATYISSIRILEDVACFGGRDRMQMFEARRNQLVPVRQLFTISRQDFYGDWENSNRATSWGLIHYLFHGEQSSLRPRFNDFATFFSRPRLGPGISVVAWNQTYREIPVDQIDGRIKDHLNSVFERPAAKCMAFPFKRPPEPPMRVEPANLTLVTDRDKVLRAHPLKNRW